MGGGFVVSGLTVYGFLVLSARAVGPEQYVAISVLYSLVSIVAFGCFLPLEQEVSRILSARATLGIGGGALVRRAVLASGMLSAVLLGAAFVGAGPLLDHAFDRQPVLLAAFAISLVSYGPAHLTRGVLLGNRRFRAYGLFLSGEGILRFMACGALLALGVRTSGPFGLLIGLPPLLAVAMVLFRERGLITPGPDTPLRELFGALGFLFAGSMLSQLLLHAAPVAVKLLADDSQQRIAGQFLAGLVVARVPIFLFQAVLAALLLKLASLAAAGRHRDFSLGLRRVVLLVVALGGAASIAGLLVGPEVMRILFGAEFSLDRLDLVFLIVASAAFMVAHTLGQALIALSGHARVTVGWLLGVVAFVVVTWAVSDLLLRVELGLLAGSATGAAAMAILLRGVTRAVPRAGVPGQVTSPCPSAPGVRP